MYIGNKGSWHIKLLKKNWNLSIGIGWHENSSIGNGIGWNFGIDPSLVNMVFEYQIFVDDNTQKFCAVCIMNKTVIERNLLNFNFFSVWKYNEVTFVGVDFDMVWWNPIIDVSKF